MNTLRTCDQRPVTEPRVPLAYALCVAAHGEVSHGQEKRRRCEVAYRSQKGVCLGVNIVYCSPQLIVVTVVNSVQAQFWPQMGVVYQIFAPPPAAAHNLEIIPDIMNI